VRDQALAGSIGLEVDQPGVNHVANLERSLAFYHLEGDRCFARRRPLHPSTAPVRDGAAQLAGPDAQQRLLLERSGPVVYVEHDRPAFQHGGRGCGSAATSVRPATSVPLTAPRSMCQAFIASHVPLSGWPVA